MYCITLIDSNKPAICTCYKQYFFNNFEEFSQKTKKSRLIKDDFDSCFKFVEDVNAKVIDSKEYEIKNQNIVVYNAYQFACPYFVYDMKVSVSKIQFLDKYYKIASFDIHGMYEDVDYIEPGLVYAVTPWGNRMIDIEYTFRGEDYSLDREKEYCMYDHFSSIACVCLEEYESKKEMIQDVFENELSEEMIDEILKDFPGEAG